MLSNQKHLFDLPEDITYLNCAYMGPMLKSTAVVGQEALQKRLQPFLYQRSDFFEPVKILKSNFAKLIHCHDPDRIAIIPSVSYGIANVLGNVDFSVKKTILLVEEQFPSNVYPWQSIAQQYDLNIKFVPAPPDGNNGQQWTERILEHIDQDVALVAMAHVHWADGTLFDLAAIREKSLEFGALMIIDGTQSVGALPFDIAKIPVDALICASYKWLLGPYGFGVAYYGPVFDEGRPIEESWINRKDSDQFEKLVHYQAEYLPKAMRYSVGEHSNFPYVAMLNDSLRQIQQWQPENIQHYCQDLVRPVLPLFEELGCSIPSPDFMAHHLFGIRMPEGIDILQLKSLLEEERVFISIRGNAIRIAPYLYNESKDLEKLYDCLKKVIQ